MKIKRTKLEFTIAIVSAIALSSCGEKYSSVVKDGITVVSNQDGAILGYSAANNGYK
jgi:beta-glucosidase